MNKLLQIYPQKFSIPYPIIQYFETNIKSINVYQKLRKTCKYFPKKFQILLVNNSFDNKICIQISNERLSVYTKAKEYSLNNNHSSIKYWLSERLALSWPPNFASLIASKVYRCDVLLLELREQILAFDEYQIFVSSGTIETVIFHKTYVKYSNELAVPFENLLSPLTNSYDIEWIMSDNELMLFPDTLENMLKIFKNFEKLNTLLLKNVNEKFDFKAFSIFLKQNKKYKISLRYICLLSEDYEDMIQDCIYEILENPPPKVPYIEFYGHDEDACTKLALLYIENHQPKTE